MRTSEHKNYDENPTPEKHITSDCSLRLSGFRGLLDRKVGVQPKGLVHFSLIKSEWQLGCWRPPTLVQCREISAAFSNFFWGKRLVWSSGDTGLGGYWVMGMQKKWTKPAGWNAWIPQTWIPKAKKSGDQEIPPIYHPPPLDYTHHGGGPAKKCNPGGGAI